MMIVRRYFLDDKSLYVCISVVSEESRNYFLELVKSLSANTNP